MPGQLAELITFTYCDSVLIYLYVETMLLKDMKVLLFLTSGNFNCFVTAT